MRRNYRRKLIAGCFCGILMKDLLRATLTLKQVFVLAERVTALHRKISTGLFRLSLEIRPKSNLTRPILSSPTFN